MVKFWWWAPLLVLMIILICVVMGVQFDMPVGVSLLAVLLAFIFSFLAVQCTGVVSDQRVRPVVIPDTLY